MRTCCMQILHCQIQILQLLMWFFQLRLLYSSHFSTLDMSCVVSLSEIISILWFTTAYRYIKQCLGLRAEKVWSLCKEDKQSNPSSENSETNLFRIPWLSSCSMCSGSHDLSSGDTIAHLSAPLSYSCWGSPLSVSSTAQSSVDMDARRRGFHLAKWPVRSAGGNCYPPLFCVITVLLSSYFCFQGLNLCSHIISRCSLFPRLLDHVWCHLNLPSVLFSGRFNWVIFGWTIWVCPDFLKSLKCKSKNGVFWRNKRKSLICVFRLRIIKCV